MQQEITELVCDGCGLEAPVHDGYEFSEFISIAHKCGYGAIHGDGMHLSIDLCQHCFAKTCKGTLKISTSLDEKISNSKKKN
jgi:hypothetical protein